MCMDLPTGMQRYISCVRSKFEIIALFRLAYLSERRCLGQHGKTTALRAVLSARGYRRRLKLRRQKWFGRGRMRMEFVLSVRKSKFFWRPSKHRKKHLQILIIEGAPGWFAAKSASRKSPASVFEPVSQGEIANSINYERTKFGRIGEIRQTRPPSLANIGAKIARGPPQPPSV
ncbi:hypothetical protein NQ318_007588 [Aromia moschata]|uniref:Uncharacterized protein n=1 Tax=Aromia moschata TaxID=1265417 RepID=A0AAV8YBN0_9CUCU|nr:hypothetical protein NQ318_007588 [Aromia moschata]